MDKPMAIGVSRAARMIGVSRKTLERHIRFRNIRAVRVGRRVLIPVAALEDFLKTNQSLRRVPVPAQEVAGALAN